MGVFMAFFIAMSTENLLDKPTHQGRGFASDNASGVHPHVMAALAEVNEGHSLAYGEDPFTEATQEVFRKHFGKESETFFVYSGTGANVLALRPFVLPHHAILASEHSHMHHHETGAPQSILGCKLIPIPSPDGKVTPESLAPALACLGNEHHAQPRVVSIAQTTEVGTVYTVAELKFLSTYIHEKGLILHMDGARISNAAAALDATFPEIVNEVGVDVLSFGGTKNGLMFGEAVVFPNGMPHVMGLPDQFKYIRKNGLQLHSKMRYMAAQYGAFLGGTLWYDCARHANAMAARLSEKVLELDGVELVWPTESNGVFIKIPPAVIPALQEETFFYTWNETAGIVRIMCSFDTREEDIDLFVNALSRLL